MSTHGREQGLAAVELIAAIVAVTDEVPRLLTVDANDAGEGGARLAGPALPRGPLEPTRDLTLERGLRRWVEGQTRVPLGYVEQLYTFGDRWRDPAEGAGGPRTLAVAYLALVRELPEGTGALWVDWYTMLPWEDHRGGRPPMLDEVIEPALDAWIACAPDREVREERAERVALAFGRTRLGWDPERALSRYELLYAVGLVDEASHDRAVGGEYMRTDAPPGRPADVLAVGELMGLDHRRIAATALSRLRGKLRYRPVVFELVPEEFTLLELQRVVEALAGQRTHKQNFRRLVDRNALVEGTGRLAPSKGGRPAELFRFRREVVLERPSSGVGPR